MKKTERQLGSYKTERTETETGRGNNHIRRKKEKKEKTKTKKEKTGRHSCCLHNHFDI